MRFISRGEEICYVQKRTQIQNMQICVHDSSGIRTEYPRARAGDDISHLILHAHSDRLYRELFVF
jgi:hypothetical protein